MKAKKSAVDRRKREKVVPEAQRIRPGDHVWVRKSAQFSGKFTKKFEALVVERYDNGVLRIRFVTDEGGPSNEKNGDETTRYKLNQIQKKIFAPTNTDATDEEEEIIVVSTDVTETSSNDTEADSPSPFVGDKRSRVNRSPEQLPAAKRVQSDSEGEVEQTTMLVSRANRKSRRRRNRAPPASFSPSQTVELLGDTQ